MIIEFFQIHWTINSYGEANSNDTQKYEKVKKLLKFCEISMVNRERIDEFTNQQRISRTDFTDTQSISH